MKTISFDIKNFEFGLIKYSKFELLKFHIKPSGCKYVGIYKKLVCSLQRVFSSFVARLDEGRISVGTTNIMLGLEVWCRWQNIRKLSSSLSVRENPIFLRFVK